ncbi:uncharacterized protein EDB93DRAFT_1253079 [Suillus bovinus]|uniref:uncharacterized protein n=1 Tax=Suillus bovinus TaxID=48563 RepID=UPI001B869301|nr:uncharacterized protein EDB93DRAFT_1253079 [Suillus bovinus]KAG2139153.1 hypothetical protein EDB93DRAFT_1253079 [Suillus bovinus]
MEHAMDLIPYIPDPPSPPSPPTPRSPPDTPTPAPHGDYVHPTQPDLLIYKGFSITSSKADNGETPIIGLTSSIHAPSHFTEDQTMSAPLSLTSGHVPTAEEQIILAQLALADTNRAVLSQNNLNHHMDLPQFTPSSTCMVLSQTPQAHAERIHSNVATIAESIHQDTPSVHVSPPQPQSSKGAKYLPIGFLVYKISDETKTSKPFLLIVTTPQDSSSA